MWMLICTGKADIGLLVGLGVSAAATLGVSALFPAQALPPAAQGCSLAWAKVSCDVLGTRLDHRCPRRALASLTTRPGVM